MPLLVPWKVAHLQRWKAFLLLNSITRVWRVCVQPRIYVCRDFLPKYTQQSHWNLVFGTWKTNERARWFFSYSFVATPSLASITHPALLPSALYLFLRYWGLNLGLHICQGRPVTLSYIPTSRLTLSWNSMSRRKVFCYDNTNLVFKSLPLSSYLAHPHLKVCGNDSHLLPFFYILLLLYFVLYMICITNINRLFIVIFYTHSKVFYISVVFFYLPM